MFPDLIVPDWPAPDRVCARQSTRIGGVSRPPYASLNLGAHVADDDADVQQNRMRLRAALGDDQLSLLWLNQVHGTGVCALPADADALTADAATTRNPGVVCAVLTADCLPILLCDRAGSVVSAVHAGWRGLCAGVIENAVAAMGVPGSDCLAWLGPAIGPLAFEVGPEVRQAFLARDPASALAFERGDGDRWFADLYALARHRLRKLGLNAIYGGDRCTFREAAYFYSYRRDGNTGRMASLIWIAA